MHSLSPLKKNIDSLIAAAVGFSIIILYTRHGGIGLCPDGVVYTSTAANFRESCRLFDFRQSAMVEFPALYPLFLSAMIFLTGLQPLAIGAVLNAFLFAVIIYLAGNITQQFSHSSRWYKASVLSCIVLSPGLLEVYSMMWSETIFILLLLLFLVTMHRYCQSHSRKVLIAAAILAAMAAVTRYAGVTMIAAGFLVIALDTTRRWPDRARELLIYSCISPSLLIVNLIRNATVGGTATGMREKSLSPLLRILHDTGSVFYDWLPFFNHHYSRAAAMTVVVTFILLFTIVRQFVQRKRLVTYESIADMFALIYLMFMVTMASVSRFETLNSRLLSPAFIPLLWSCSSWIVPVSQKIPPAKSKWVILFGILLLLVFQYGQLSADYETWDGVKDAGIPGYTEDQWKNSPTVRYIQNDSLPFKKGYAIFSNANDAVYFFTGRQGWFLPNKENVKGVKAFLGNSRCYVIWFDDGDNPDLIGKDFMVNTKKMKLVKQFDDGAIYESDP